MPKGLFNTEDKMKINFLGTSFGAPYRGRHQQAILIETENGNAYLFDAGAPVTDILSFAGYDMSKIKTVFISHLHGDHMNGLNDMINLAEFFNIRCDIFLSEQRGIKAFTEYTYMQLGNNESQRVSFKLIGEGCFYDDGSIKVTAFSNAHMERGGFPSYSFLIEADGKCVYITSDLHPSLKDIPSLLEAKSIELLITELAHFEPDVMVDKCNTLKADSVAFVHVMPPEKYVLLKALEGRMKFKPLYPNDSEVYEI